MVILYIYLACIVLAGACQLIFNLRFMAFALFVLTYPISPFVSLRPTTSQDSKISKFLLEKLKKVEMMGVWSNFF